MSQQLSSKVADIIHGRYIALFDGREPDAQQVLETPHEKLRNIGLSNAKAQYIKNVAAFHLEHGLDFKILNKLDNEAVIAYTTQIKGVGRWTAEMLLMFALGREDVMPLDDLGIQNAMIRLYKLETGDKKQLKADMIRISNRWSPYRTYACLHLWKYLS
ncbi:MAG: DNA-3-methyladenine glycosylase family protein [Chitinophagales bacterium]